MRSSPSFDAAKFKELILYISFLEQQDEMFGSTKLNKILYFADFEAYRKLGAPITGAEYQHLPEGPAPRQLLPYRRELEANGDLAMQPRRYFSYSQMAPIALREPDLSLFTSEELSIVRAAIDMLRGMNAKAVSALSHDEWGWKLTEDFETIAYRTAWLSPDPLSLEQIQRAQEA